MAHELINKYTEEQIQMGRDAYFDGNTYEEISRLSGLKVSAVRYYVNKSWFQEREEQSSALLLHFAGSKKKLLHEISQNSLSILNKSLRKWLEEDYVLSPKEANNIVSILSNMDKIIRLDDGNPTEISALKESAKKVYNIDPLNKEIEEVEVVDE